MFCFSAFARLLCEIDLCPGFRNPVNMSVKCLHRELFNLLFFNNNVGFGNL